MDTLNEFLLKKIYTEEALELTEEAIDLLASHYTTWHYRYDIIQHLNYDRFVELDWCEVIALENEKNYQIWNYRQRIIGDIMADPELASRFDTKRELPIMSMMLDQDSKNHHVWSYRKWFVETFKLYNDPAELEFVEKAIDADLRNNSAWTHRFFLKVNGSGFAGEDQFCMDRIDMCPQNPSPWNYLSGMYRETGRPLGELEQFCLKHGDIEQEKIASTFAVEMLAQIAVDNHNVARGTQLYGALAETYDPIRAHYWNYLRSQLRSETAGSP